MKKPIQKYALFFSAEGVLRGVRLVERIEGCQIKLQDPPPDGTGKGDRIGQVECSLN